MSLTSDRRRGGEAEVVSAMDALDAVPLRLGQGPEDSMWNHGAVRGLVMGDGGPQALCLFAFVELSGRHNFRWRGQSLRYQAGFKYLSLPLFRGPLGWVNVRWSRQVHHATHDGRQVVANLCQRPVADRGIAWQQPLHVGYDIVEAVEMKRPSTLGHRWSPCRQAYCVPEIARRMKPFCRGLIRITTRILLGGASVPPLSFQPPSRSIRSISWRSKQKSRTSRSDRM